MVNVHRKACGQQSFANDHMESSERTALKYETAYRLVLFIEDLSRITFKILRKRSAVLGKFSRDSIVRTGGRPRIVQINIFRNRTGVHHDVNMKYDLALASPKEFYHEVHRPAHFLIFSGIEEGEVVGIDREDMFQ